MRLIDVDALIKYLRDTYCDTSRPLWHFSRHVMAMGIIDVLENCPAVEERKHGHWELTEDTISCPFCDYWNLRKKEQRNGVYVYSKTPNYCPNCGAEMESTK